METQKPENKQKTDEVKEVSMSYKLGYATTMNNGKLGFSLYDHLQSKDTKEAMLQAVIDYSRGVDHAKEKILRKSPEKKAPEQQKTR